jgi:hypothetical protein
MVLVGTTPAANPAKIAIPALRDLGPTRTAKALALAAWYLSAWFWRSESKGKDAARYAVMAVTQEGVPAVSNKVKGATAVYHFRTTTWRATRADPLPGLICPADSMRSTVRFSFSMASEAPSLAFSTVFAQVSDVLVVDL